MNTAAIVLERWSYCNAPHDEGMSYGDHIGQ